MNSIYNWDAAEYEKHSSQQQLWTQDVIRSQKLAGDERILDIGCGDGKVTAELAALVPKGCVLGIDLSESMVAFANRRFANATMLSDKSIPSTQPFGTSAASSAVTFPSPQPISRIRSLPASFWLRITSWVHSCC